MKVAVVLSPWAWRASHGRGVFGLSWLQLTDVFGTKEFFTRETA